MHIHAQWQFGCSCARIRLAKLAAQWAKERKKDKDEDDKPLFEETGAGNGVQKPSALHRAKVYVARRRDLHTPPPRRCGPAVPSAPCGLLA